MDTDPLVQHIRDQHGELKSARSPEEGLWSEVFQYTAPRRGDFFESTPGGGQRKRHVLDSTAATACGLAASHLLHAVATPGSNWFNVSVGNGKQDTSGAVAQWREDTVETVMGHLTDETPLNIYAELYAFLLDLASIGTAATFTDERNGQALGRNVPMTELWIDTDHYGVPDTFYRTPRLSYRQAAQRWPGFGRDRAMKGHEKADILVAVVPANDPYWREQIGNRFPAAAEAAGAEYVTIEIDCTDNKVLRFGHFQENPYSVARWYTRPGSPYGRSPGQDVLPVMRLVNAAMDTYLRQQAKLADPPILLPAGQMISPLRLFPGAISFSDGEVTPQFLIPPGGSRIEFSMELINRAQEDIRRGFFNPFFYNVNGQVKTARLALDTPVPLASGGWTTMGDVQPGDVVVGSSGQSTTVTHVHPIVQSNEVWELEFGSGDKVVADDEHRWSVLRTNTTLWRTMTTRELVADLTNPKSGNANYSVPRLQKVDRAPAVLPIDPYVFGLWLGDGSARDAVITTMDGEVVDAAQSWAEGEGFSVVLRDKSDAGNKAVDVSIRGPSKRWGDSMTARLDELGVRNNKHIPEAYLFGSHDQRLALLQGLMDSDGSVSGRGRPVFYQQPGRVLDGFVALAESLGLWPRVHNGGCRKEGWAEAVSVAFTSPWPVFRLPRKAAKQVLSTRQRDRQCIVAARKVENRPVRCITVDAPDHLYCVGRRFTVTSNTQVLQESDDRNKSIAPMLVRIQRELQWPKVRRVMAILQRAGRVQPPPVEGGISITFKNPTLDSQKITEAMSTMRFFEGAAAWNQVDPGVFDNIDVDKVIPMLREGFGAPATIMHTAAGARAKRKKREDAEQQQQQQVMALQAAETMAKVQAAQR